MLPNVTQTLRASNAVRSLVGTRIYRHGDAEQDVQRPYVTWFVVYGDPENNMDGLPPIDRYSVQIDCWSATDAGVETLAQAVRDAVEPTQHMVSIAADGRDPETQSYRIGLVFDWWHGRN